MAKSDLRGPSADALEALTEKLGPAKGIVPTVARLATKVTRIGNVDGPDMVRTGEDLFGVASVLRAEPGLRRTVTDASTDASAKSGLIRQIFGGRISDVAVDLVADAVERRWTRPRDLADALEHLAVVAFVDSAGDEADTLSDELFAVAQLINERDDLRTALSDPARSGADKGRLLSDLLGGKTLTATQRLAQQALAGSHRTVTIAIEEYQKIAAEAHNQRVATVYVAQALSDDEIGRLELALSNQYGRTVHLNMVIDPSILGGLRVEIGDDVIDGTVSGRLEDAQRKLAG
jgi:F-type H+-transporting ATPase subunit delta